jgi:hypothetical protein
MSPLSRAEAVKILSALNRGRRGSQGVPLRPDHRAKKDGGVAPAVETLQLDRAQNFFEMPK